jgi:FkbH-like protein
MSMLDWLPAPVDLRERLRSALALADPQDRLEQLAVLAAYRLGYLETIQLDSAMAKTSVAGASRFAAVRLALLSSCTADHLAPAIRVAGLRRRLLIEVYLAPFGQYRQQVLDPATPLSDFKPDLVLLSLSAREMVAGVALDATHDEAERAVAAAVAQLREIWRQARDRFGAVVIQQSFLDVSEPLFGSYDRLVAAAPSRLVGRLNDALAAQVAAEGVLLLDVARASSRDGLDNWFDVTRWLQAKIEVAPQAAPAYGELVARLAAAHLGRSKKCLVLDLDNTLWGGVIGDDGVEGIVLGAGSALGEAHSALQRYAKSLAERGVILAVCSRNDPAVAEAAFRDHPEMLLQRSDFAAFVANWDDKAANLGAIAAQLNIGLDALVFVDDNPAERARVREALPLVAVPELPPDAAHYVRCLADAGYFEAISFTAEDRDRARQYSANAERDAVRATAQSLTDFLRDLAMTVVFGPIEAVDLARAAQLLNKTNQFNTTARRYSAEAVARIAQASENIALQYRLVDRFGDNGLVSVMLLVSAADDPTVLEVANWVMSCRVFGRQLEAEAMNIAVEAALRRGARGLRADYVPTGRNGVVSALFENLGFSPQPAPGADAGASRWTLALADYVPRPTFIARKASRD